MKNKKIQIQINGTFVKVTPQITVLQACENVGIEIPRFCFHERLQIAGNCRICLVEIFKSPKPQAACAIPVADGMQIFTDRPLVKKARESVLELILKNHPLDCPICDQGGECDLQDEAWNFGRPWSRFIEKKRSVLDKNIGPLIKTVMNRCIHCTRCVRFSTEIAGVEILGTTSRGETTEIGTYINQLFERELSGNVIDLCPVGALTSKPYSFTTRPWELNSVNSIDLTDAIGSNIRLDSRGNDLLRILPRLNENINEEWITDKARFCLDGLNNQRLLKPIVKINGLLKEISIKQSIVYFYKLLQENLNAKNSIGFFVGKTVDLETLTFTEKLCDSLPNSFLGYHKPKSTFSTDSLDNFGFQSNFYQVENADLCLLVGTNPRTEGTLINTRLRKGKLKGNLEVYYVGPSINLTYKSKQLRNNYKWLLDLIEGKNKFCTQLLVAKKPIIIIGSDLFSSKNGKFILNFCELLKSKIPNLQINLLHNDASEINSLFLGAASNKSDKAVGLGIALEKTNLSNNVSNWIYFGSHLNQEVLSNPNLKLCIPIKTFAEKKGTFINLTKDLQKTHKIISNSRSIESSLINIQKSIFITELLNVNFRSLVNFTKAFNSDKLFSNNDWQRIKLNRSYIQAVNVCLIDPISTLDNEKILFQSNIICQNSHTLAKCARIKSWTNF